MTCPVHRLSLDPFFLATPQGNRFCIFYPAAGLSRGSVVYVHPFTEEMNKSRRMVALQSRALAAAGFSVLQIDLYGCGDSSGDFEDARWEIWQQDIALGVRWLSSHADGPVTLWGLRLGALLALDSASLCDPAPAHILLWQPVVSGEALLTQFFRLRLASEMMTDGRARSAISDIRAQMSAGQTTEIAGYSLSAELAAQIDKLNLSQLAFTAGVVNWFEVTAESGRDLPPGARRVADSWLRDGVQLGIHCVQGPSFWNTVETSECPKLLTATTEVMRDWLR